MFGEAARSPESKYRTGGVAIQYGTYLKAGSETYVRVALGCVALGVDRFTDAIALVRLELLSFVKSTWRRLSRGFLIRI